MKGKLDITQRNLRRTSAHVKFCNDRGRLICLAIFCWFTRRHSRVSWWGHWVGRWSGWSLDFQCPEYREKQIPMLPWWLRRLVRCKLPCLWRTSSSAHTTGPRQSCMRTTPVTPTQPPPPKHFLNFKNTGPGCTCAVQQDTQCITHARNHDY